MIKAVGIKKSYAALQVLKGIDLYIEKGEIVSIVGASGAGKSTLLHILGTLDGADEGSVWINEKEVLPPLSVPQFRMLQLLYNQPGKAVTRQELVLAIWGDGGAVGISGQALDALVRRLRERLSSIDPNYEYIITIRGHGIRLENPEK